MHVHCRLLELAAKREITMADLHRRTGIDAEQLRKLRDGLWVSIKRDAMERLLEELEATLDELFVAFDDNIWTPIRIEREVTIHFGSNSLPEVPRDRSTRHGRSLRESIGYWDLRAFFIISEYVNRLGAMANLKFKAHPTDLVEQGAVEDVFRKGNHLIIGSPIANVVAEGVVSRAFGVPPNSSSLHDEFPYNFVWDRRMRGVSSFGITARGEDEMGVISTKTRKLVAQRTLVAHGSRTEGKDCALIVTYLPGSERDLAHRKGAPARDAQRIIIAILGHSGPGTLAGAATIIDEENRAQLYPLTSTQPRMRVVGATYVRQAPGPRDSRMLNHRWLVAEDALSVDA